MTLLHGVGERMIGGHLSRVPVNHLQGLADHEQRYRLNVQTYCRASAPATAVDSLVTCDL
jgi:hypothetical protein